MNGIHDVGGKHGFGPVEVDTEEPRFHAEWERRAFGLNMATLAQGFYNVDENRYARELMHPAAYLSSSYWQHILAAMETCLIAHGTLSLEEIDARVAELARNPDLPVPEPTHVDEASVVARMSVGITRQRTVSRSPRFSVGDPVVTRLDQPIGHTRLPEYARGRHGTVTQVRDPYVYPDTNALGLGENPEHLYQVTFTNTDLWGHTSTSKGAVVVDLWESYLDSRERGSARHQ